MELLRFVVALVVMCGLCFGLLTAITTALRTGRIRYGRAQGEHVAKRKAQPLTFWLIIFGFALLAFASIVAFAWVARETLFKLLT